MGPTRRSDFQVISYKSCAKLEIQHSFGFLIRLFPSTMSLRSVVINSAALLIAYMPIGAFASSCPNGHVWIPAPTEVKAAAKLTFNGQEYQCPIDSTGMNYKCGERGEIVFGVNRDLVIADKSGTLVSFRSDSADGDGNYSKIISANQCEPVSASVLYCRDLQLNVRTYKSEVVSLQAVHYRYDQQGWRCKKVEF